MEKNEFIKNYLNVYESVRGFLVINKNEEVVFMGKALIEELGLTEEEILGQKVGELIPTTKIQKTLETGEQQIGVMYFVEGYTVICNSYPIYENGRLVGAVEVDIFSGAAEVEAFLKEVAALPDLQQSLRKDIGANQQKYAKYSMEDIRGSGLKNKRLKEEIIQASRSNSTLLITGETGCGKELVAHAVHKLGHRSLFNFVRLNCAAIPSELFESELFGYEKGSFTGASKEGKKGKVEIANNGTLFLDEVDSLSAQMQAKLLRFLQEKEIYRIGGEYAIPVNTRIIAATNRDIKELVKEKHLREDLYYRLNVLEIRVPPLRERLEDIKEIVEGIVKRLNVELDRTAYEITTIDERIYPLLMTYEWPGNIRELSNVVEKAMSACYSHKLNLEHFRDIFDNLLGTTMDSEITIELKDQTIQSIKQESEKKLILFTFQCSDRNMKATAEKLGISVQMLYRKFHQYGIK